MGGSQAWVSSNSVNITGGTVASIIGGQSYKEGFAASNSVYISGNSTIIKGSVYGGYIMWGTGSASYNIVNISGGTINGDVHGGAANEYESTNNSVIISGGTVNRDVGGGFSYSGSAASNSVNISGGTVGQHVFGGWTKAGNAASNSVNISGDTTNILGNIYGGVASSTGNADYNQVNISSGTLKRVYGGYSEAGSVTSNSINISGNSTKLDAVIGGYVDNDTGSASYNLVTMSGGTVEGSVSGGWSIKDVASNSVNISNGIVNYVYGGHSDKGNAASNSVTISGGKITKDVYCGWSNTGLVTGNSVYISDGEVNQKVYGGITTNLAASNSVNISGGTVNDVYGGFSSSGLAASNSVNISGGTINKYVYGGYSNNGYAAGNIVTISGNSTQIGDVVFDDYVYGGYVATGTGSAYENKVSINGGKVNESVFGGYSYEGIASSNSVNINGGMAKSLCGGSSSQGNSENNSVNISGDTIISNAVYGGKTEKYASLGNSVSISSGTVNLRVSGGYSNYGLSASNSVNISGGCANEVYGGYSSFGNAASNSVTISGGKITKDVYGGWSNIGLVTGNSVYISDGEVNQKVYGGITTNLAASNSVNISGGTVNESVYGGYSSSENVTSNSVNISGGKIGNIYGGFSGNKIVFSSGIVASNTVYISGDATEITDNVYGGYSENSNGLVIDNKVDICSGTLKIVYGGFSEAGSVASNSINISGNSTKINNVYGGYVNSGTGSASYNIVNISGGTVNQYVYGGLSETGDAASNSVNISGGNICNQSSSYGKVYGGYSEFSNAASNSVNISDGTVWGEVLGGHSYSGSVASNSVNISGGTVNGFVYGGYSYNGNAASNSVNISGGTISKDVYGGWSSWGNATSNSVNISSGTIESVWGGYEESGPGSVCYNIVNISGGTVNNEVYGGHSASGNAASNSVNITGGEVNLVYGGHSAVGDAASNSVNISGGTFGTDSKIYASNIISPISSTIKDNFVNLSGTVTGLDNTEIYGYYFENDSGTHSGNILHIGRAVDYDENGNIKRDTDGKIIYKSDETTIWNGKTSDGTINNSVNKIANFDSIALHSIAWNNDLPAIKAAALENIGTVDITDLKFYENGSEKTAFTIGDKMNIIQWDNASEAIINLKYIPKDTDDEQTSAFADKNNEIAVKTLAISETNNGISLNRKVNGNVKKLDKALEYSITDFTLDSVDLSNWNGTTAALPDDLTANTNGVIVKGVFSDLGLSAGETQSILTSSNAMFKDEKIDESIRFAEKSSFKDDSANGVTLSGSQTGGVKSSDNGKTLTYYAISKEVSDIAFGSMKWGIGRYFSSNGAYDFKKVTKIDASGLRFTTPEEVNGSMELVSAAKNLEAGKAVIASSHSQKFDTMLDNKVVVSATLSGEVSVEAEKVKYVSNGTTISKFNLANWDGEKASSINTSWELADDATVETDGMSKLPDTDSEKQILILKSDKDGYFANVAINGKNALTEKQFTASDEAERVVLSLTQDIGVTLDSAKKNIFYKVGSKDVTSLKLNSIIWEDGAELLNCDKYNYSKLTTLDTKDFNVVFEKPETVESNKSMTLLKANDTLADIAVIDNTLSYQYAPVSGVNIDAVIRSSLEAKSGKVTLNTVSHKADKLTFGAVDWLDKGALIDHKTMLNNVSFEGAAVDTSKIAFTNKQRLDADMQMTLVSDFDGTPSTITGSKYKVGTAYLGEGFAYMDGRDLVFKTKTGAGLSDETHTTVMAMDAGVAMLAAGNEHVGNAIEGLSIAANAGSDGVSTYASMGGSSSRYETGSHVDTNSWNCTLAVGKNLEKKDGTMEYGLFAEYGRGNYTLHMDGIADAGSGNNHYTGGGLLMKFTNKHDVYTEASFRMGSMKDKASSLLHDGVGNAYGYDTSAKYRGGHIGFGKAYKEEDGTKLEIYGKYFYNQREGINFAAGADQYSLDEVRSRVLRVGFRLSSTDKKWNRYGGIAYDYEFGGQSNGTVNGNQIRAASVKGGTLRGEFGYCREATKDNPWKTDISLYGFTGQRRGFGGSVAFEYRF